MMKRRIVVTAVVFVALVALVGFNLLTSETARAQATDECAHAPTIASLEACVEHAADQGFINNQGVTNSLLAKLDAAQATPMTPSLSSRATSVAPVLAMATWRSWREAGTAWISMGAMMQHHLPGMGHSLLKRYERVS